VDNDRNAQPQEFSTGYGNRMTVSVNLATGKARVLNDAETAREAAEATRRAADKSNEVVVLASSASL
jgi:hypothetical protein